MNFKLKRHHVVPLVMFLLVLLTLGGSYQFFFKQQLEEFRENQQRLDTLQKILTRLEQSFEGQNGRAIEPVEAVSQWRGAVVPWRDAMLRRGGYFQMGELLEIDPVPAEEEMFPRFYYVEAYDKLYRDLRENARLSRVYFNDAINFDVPTPDDIRGRNVTRQDVWQWLRQYQFGSNIAQMLFDAGVYQVYAIELWPRYMKRNLVQAQTIGLSFEATLDTLVELLEEMHLNNDRYMTVEGMRITNGNLLMQRPLLQVEMLVTLGWFNTEQVQGPAATDGGGGAQGQAAAGGGSPLGEDILERLRQRRAERESEEESSWRMPMWMRYFWPF